MGCDSQILESFVQGAGIAPADATAKLKKSNRGISFGEVEHVTIVVPQHELRPASEGQFVSALQLDQAMNGVEKSVSGMRCSRKLLRPSFKQPSQLDVYDTASRARLSRASSDLDTAVATVRANKHACSPISCGLCAGGITLSGDHHGCSLASAVGAIAVGVMSIKLAPLALLCAGAVAAKQYFTTSKSDKASRRSESSRRRS